MPPASRSRRQRVDETAGEPIAFPPPAARNRRTYSHIVRTAPPRQGNRGDGEPPAAMVAGNRRGEPLSLSGCRSRSRLDVRCRTPCGRLLLRGSPRVPHCAQTYEFCLRPRNLTPGNFPGRCDKDSTEMLLSRSGRIGSRAAAPELTPFTALITIHRTVYRGASPQRYISSRRASPRSRPPALPLAPWTTSASSPTAVPRR